MTANTSRSFDKVVQQEDARLATLHPTEKDIPGCLTLFDTFMQCYIVGNQIRSLYRYGHGSDCSDKWNDVKFCLSMKSLEGEERRRAWLRHRAEWWAQRRLSRSSEDVWDVRTEPLPPLQRHSS
ncbi:hypothetical protein DL93DRAFT_2071888 [Clavulina sp. PMI_390]|nr:hypothetical protein DL93DRAFT_2071888 [Clavulina sp. PMI_390]